ncbi:MAG: AraC family transcriptional regulator [Clostridiales bacterium]|nr:AraC family transcriptional regulator [Clostridiales bacterium]
MKVLDNCLNSSTEQTVFELDVYQCGHEKCNPGHSYGYAIRDHYLIHYIVGGCGEYNVGGRKYELSKGDGFLICPSVSTMYKASMKNPWEYYWIGFYGTEAKKILEMANLGPNNIIFHNDDKVIKELLSKMYYTLKDPNCPEIETLGYLYIFLSKLIKQYKFQNKSKHNNANYVEKAINYVKCNYSRDLTIQELADFIGVDRSQLFRLFKLQTNISPQQYIINYRIAKACELIKTTNLSVEEIARSVGFKYPSYFFRIFKRETAMTPLQYKNKTCDNNLRKG